MNIQDIELIKVNRDANGNSRYVTHFFNILSDKEQKEIYEAYIKNHGGSSLGVTSVQYMAAINKAREIGGKKYRAKDFGGGIVFQSTMPKQLRQEIFKLRGE